MKPTNEKPKWRNEGDYSYYGGHGYVHPTASGSYLAVCLTGVKVTTSRSAAKKFVERAFKEAT